MNVEALPINVDSSSLKRVNQHAGSVFMLGLLMGLPSSA